MSNGNDDQSLTLGSGYGGDTATAPPPPDKPDTEPSTAPDSSKDDSAPRAQPVSPEEQLNDARQKAYIEQLERNYYEGSQRSDKMFAQIQDSMRRLQEVANQPPPTPPQQLTVPPLPTEQQKGGLSQFVVELLKFGALTAIAYGASGRGYMHNAIYKGAIGAALEGYANGRKDVSDRAMQLWEKNRQVINEANREQNTRYHQILEDNRLSLQQKMDILNNQSKLFGDYRTEQATKNQNLVDLLKAIQDREKLQRDKETHEIKGRAKVYDVLGKGNLPIEYLAWVNQQSGGRVRLTGNSDANEWFNLEKEHPEWSWHEFLKVKEEEDKRKATEKAATTETARLRAAYEEKKREEEEDKHVQHGGTKSDPLGLGLGP